jgi:translation initiation factor 3 subunit D
VTTKSEWPLKREIPLFELGKLQVDAKDVKTTDLLWCGELSSYDKSYDRLAVRTEQNLRRFEDLNFFNVTTSEDPILTDYMQSDPEVTVIATDHVLASLIAASRSVYSWDLVITKLSNKIIMDKRDFSPVDFLSVNETAAEPPNADDKDAVNGVAKLSQEAGAINQNFTQMVLDYNIDPEEMENPNPFEEEGEGRASSGAYRYRKFVIPGNSKDSNEFNQQPCGLVVRTEVSCKMPGGDPEHPQLCSLKALNEYDPKVNYSWRKHLETQRGMVLATEIKNNAFKLGRWTAQAILAGCDTMKIGFVSRIGNDPWSHSILSVQNHITDRFAEQIGMHRNNVFGIIRAIVDMVMSWEDGKYLLIKDPLKSIVRLYEVPWETFNEEDEGDGDDDDEDEDEDIDMDGNIAPSQPVGPMSQ